MKKLLLHLIMIFFFLQTGCTQTYIVDTQRIIHVAGFDITKNKRFQGTILFPEYTHGVKSKPETQSTSARSLETIASRLNAKSPHNVVVGQMRVVLFGKTLGERGMGEIITNLQRDPNIGRDVQLAIVDGSAEELLNRGKQNGSLSIVDLLEQNIRNENIPQTSLNVFLYNYYSSVCDAYVPYIKTDANHSVVVKGLAFLKDDKVVMYTDKRHSVLTKLLINPTKNGRYEAAIKKNKHKGMVVIQDLAGKSKYDIDQTGDIPKVKINLKLDGLIKNSPTWIDLRKKRNINYIKKQIERNVEKDCEGLIKQFQEKEIDPLGIRDEIRSHTRKWNIKQIRNMYQNIDIDVNLDINIVQSGIGE
ncbi:MULTISPECIES: Ger(x)C family spore germination protein [Bacillus]|uniref:Ger(X)C family spore germination protein n=1 Tax=Bacillus pacificus TaxID=2026187 RepID=A0AAP4CW10_9BACI|nr:MULTISPECIES: Ger(x)C family spore germination protein [Bacillus]KXY79331.1 spore gernimation protein GerC [Bacillus cereus]MCU5157298.1 Ger(x)C family spore germination protein [Bacillus pacificus]MCU9944802.1 Ger(x)C family spore germination protein [Bacillus pacificus]MDA1689887.1 Ger(x)C family spore germination protein [Bacillus cereus group sp. TH147LC]MDK7389002.1 Ger(x)C family spore germination protein [Bacillus pacificus]